MFRQLDDIRFWRFHQLAQFGQIVADALLFGQEIGEGRQNAASQRNILGADADACGAGEPLDDRQQRSRGKLWRFIHLGVDDVGNGLVGHVWPLLEIWGHHKLFLRPP